MKVTHEKLEKYNEMVDIVNEFVDDITEKAENFIGKKIMKVNGGYTKKFKDEVINPIYKKYYDKGYTIHIIETMYSVYVNLFIYINNERLEFSHHLFDIKDKCLNAVNQERYYQKVNPDEVINTVKELEEHKRYYKEKLRELERKIPYNLRD